LNDVDAVCYRQKEAITKCEKEKAAAPAAAQHLSDTAQQQ